MPISGDIWGTVEELEHPRGWHGRWIKKWSIGREQAQKISSLLDGMHIRTFPSQAGAVQYAFNESSKHRSQGFTIRRFRDDWHGTNAALRAGKHDPATDAYTRMMDQSMQDLGDDLVVHRIVGPEVFGLGPEALAMHPDEHDPSIQTSGIEDLTGKLLSDPGYTSSSIGFAPGQGQKPIHMVIAAPKGTRVMFPGQGSQMVFDRGQEVRVTKVHPDGQGGYYVYAVATPKSGTADTLHAPEGEAQKAAEAGTPEVRQAKAMAPSVPVTKDERAVARQQNEDEAARAAQPQPPPAAQVIHNPPEVQQAPAAPQQTPGGLPPRTEAIAHPSLGSGTPAPNAAGTPEAPAAAPETHMTPAHFRQVVKDADLPVPSEGPRRREWNNAYLGVADGKKDPHDMLRELESSIAVNKRRAADPSSAHDTELPHDIQAQEKLADTIAKSFNLPRHKEEPTPKAPEVKAPEATPTPGHEVPTGHTRHKFERPGTGSKATPEARAKMREEKARLIKPREAPKEETKHALAPREGFPGGDRVAKANDAIKEHKVTGRGDAASRNIERNVASGDWTPIRGAREADAAAKSFRDEARQHEDNGHISPEKRKEFADRSRAIADQYDNLANKLRESQGVKPKAKAPEPQTEMEKLRAKIRTQRPGTDEFRQTQREIWKLEGRSNSVRPGEAPPSREPKVPTKLSEEQQASLHKALQMPAPSEHGPDNKEHREISQRLENGEISPEEGAKLAEAASQKYKKAASVVHEHEAESGDPHTRSGQLEVTSHRYDQWAKRLRNSQSESELEKVRRPTQAEAPKATKAAVPKAEKVPAQKSLSLTHSDAATIHDILTSDKHGLSSGPQVQLKGNKLTLTPSAIEELRRGRPGREGSIVDTPNGPALHFFGEDLPLSGGRAPAAPKVSTPKVESGDGLEKNLKKDLLETARREGVPGVKTAHTKAQIIEAIRGHRSAPVPEHKKLSTETSPRAEEKMNPERGQEFIEKFNDHSGQMDWPDNSATRSTSEIANDVSQGHITPSEGLTRLENDIQDNHAELADLHAQYRGMEPGPEKSKLHRQIQDLEKATHNQERTSTWWRAHFKQEEAITPAEMPKIQRTLEVQLPESMRGLTPEHVDQAAKLGGYDTPKGTTREEKVADLFKQMAKRELEERGRKVPRPERVKAPEENTGGPNIDTVAEGLDRGLLNPIRLEQMQKDLKTKTPDAVGQNLDEYLDGPSGPRAQMVLARTMRAEQMAGGKKHTDEENRQFLDHMDHLRAQDAELRKLSDRLHASKADRVAAPKPEPVKLTPDERKEAAHIADVAGVPKAKVERKLTDRKQEAERPSDWAKGQADLIKAAGSDVEAEGLLKDKTAADLREIAKALGVKPGRSKAETIERIKRRPGKIPMGGGAGLFSEDPVKRAAAEAEHKRFQEATAAGRAAAGLPPDLHTPGRELQRAGVPAAEAPKAPGAGEPLSPQELAVVTAVSRLGRNSDSGWISAAGMKSEHRKILDGLAEKGWLDKSGDHYRINRPKEQLLPRPMEAEHRRALGDLNEGAIIEGYADPAHPGRFENVPPVGADPSRIRKISVQRMEPVDENGQPIRGHFNQTHRIITGHDVTTGERVTSGPVSVGSTWNWHVNPDEPIPGDIEGQAFPTKETKAIGAPSAPEVPKATGGPEAPHISGGGQFVHFQTKDGKRYIMRRPGEHSKEGGGAYGPSVSPSGFTYWSERNGKQFGPVRHSNPDAKTGLHSEGIAAWATAHGETPKVEEPKVTPVKAAKAAKAAAPARAPKDVVEGLKGARTVKEGEDLLQGHTKAQLADIAKEAGVEHPKGATKAEIHDLVLRRLTTNRLEHEAYVGLGDRAKMAAAFTEKIKPFSRDKAASHLHDASYGELEQVAKHVGITGAHFNNRVELEQAILNKTHPSGPKLSSKPILENTWGGRGSAIHYHADGEIGMAVKSLKGDEKKLDIKGEPLENALGYVATDLQTGKIDNSQAVARLQAIRAQLPEGNARDRLDHAIKRMDVKPAEPISLPDGTPEPLRRLADELSKIPLANGARIGGGHGHTDELDAIKKLAEDVAAGKWNNRSSGIFAEDLLRGAHNKRHESQEGKMAIDRAVLEAYKAIKAGPSKMPARASAPEAKAPSVDVSGLRDKTKLELMTLATSRGISPTDARGRVKSKEELIMEIARKAGSKG